MQFNYYTNGTGGHEYIYKLGFDASQSFHKYAFEWQKDYIAWFVDSKEVYRATNNIPTTPGKIMMNLWPGTGVDGWLGSYNDNTPIYAYYDSMSYTPSGNPSNTQTPANTTSTVNPVTPTTPISTPTSTVNANKYDVDYSINSDWGNGASVKVKITNKTNASKNGWNVNWDFPGNQKITNMWGGKYSQNGTSTTVSNESYNSTIPSGGSVELGFNISYTGSNAKPTLFNVE